MMAFSCEEKTSVEPFIGNIVRVSSGQSFGMCMGRCYNELIVENNTVTLKQIERKERGGEQKTMEYHENSRFHQIKADLNDFPKKKFLKLDEVYGCPDCADGGTEWLEVRFSDGSSKRVIFNYGSTVTGFEEVISALRAHRLFLMDKYK